jgi:hypothetical protein
MKTAASALTDQGLSPGDLKIAKENIIKILTPGWSNSKMPFLL